MLAERHVQTVEGRNTIMVQLENIEAIETRLWRAADLMRSGSELASNEYFMPVMGLIFLRHAYSRFLSVKPEIEAKLSNDYYAMTLARKIEDRFSFRYVTVRSEFDAFRTQRSTPSMSDLEC